MPFIETTPPGMARGPVREMYLGQQSAFGYVPNYAKAFCHRPELMTLWADLQRGIRRHIEPARFELVTLAAALALRSSSCSLAHGRKLTEHFPPEAVSAVVEEVAAALGDGVDVPANDSGSPLSEAERAMVRYAARVAHDATRITPADVAELSHHGLTGGEIFDLAATAAARAFFTKVLDGVGAAPDAAFRDLEPAFRDMMTVGRDIGTEPVARIAEGS